VLLSTVCRQHGKGKNCASSRYPTLKYKLRIVFRIVRSVAGRYLMQSAEQLHLVFCQAPADSQSHARPVRKVEREFECASKLPSPTYKQSQTASPVHPFLLREDLCVQTSSTYRLQAGNDAFGTCVSASSWTCPPIKIQRVDQPNNAMNTCACAFVCHALYQKLVESGLCVPYWSPGHLLQRGLGGVFLF
jgi:hypothetical protein